MNPPTTYSLSIELAPFVYEGTKIFTSVYDGTCACDGCAWVWEVRGTIKILQIELAGLSAIDQELKNA